MRGTRHEHLPAPEPGRAEAAGGFALSMTGTENPDLRSASNRSPDDSADQIGGYRMPVVPSCDRRSHRGSSPALMATRGRLVAEVS